MPQPEEGNGSMSKAEARPQRRAFVRVADYTDIACAPAEARDV